MTNEQYNKHVKPYIETYKDVINNNDFDDMFMAAAKHGDQAYLFQFLNNDVDLDILNNVSTLQPKMFSRCEKCRMKKLIIPSNIDNFSQEAFQKCLYGEVWFEVLYNDSVITPYMFRDSITKHLYIGPLPGRTLSLKSFCFHNSDLQSITVCNDIDAIYIESDTGLEWGHITMRIPNDTQIFFEDVSETDQEKLLDYIEVYK